MLKRLKFSPHDQMKKMFHHQVLESSHVWSGNKVPLCLLLSAAGWLHVHCHRHCHNCPWSLLPSRTVQGSKSCHPRSKSTISSRWGGGIYAGTLLLYAQVQLSLSKHFYFHFLHRQLSWSLLLSTLYRSMFISPFQLLVMFFWFHCYFLCHTEVCC